MLFRNLKGELIIINKQDYHNDLDYYNDICKVHNIIFPKDVKEFDRILKLIETKTHYKLK